MKKLFNPSVLMGLLPLIMMACSDAKRVGHGALLVADGVVSIILKLLVGAAIVTVIIIIISSFGD